MEIVSIEKKTFEMMVAAFGALSEKVAALRRKSDTGRMERWLTGEEVCGQLRISPRTLQTLRDRRLIGYSQKKEEFLVRKGPVFANFVLADEINRSPAKVQSALLEAMQERQVTIGDETYPLPEPFLVLATQNPLEQEGTYPLPEAQVDRFMLKAKISYPQKQEERDIMRMNLAGEGLPKVNKVTSPEDIVKARRVVEEVYMDEKIEKYIIDIIFATREPAEYNLEKLQPLIAYGGSPRASISLAKAARAYAFIRRRGYVIPEDVRAVCHDVLRHRIGLTYEAEAENITTEQIITDILNNVIVP